MFNLSAVKILIIVVVVVIFLGPDKLPEAAQRIGRFWAQFKVWQRRVEAEVREAIPNLPSTDSLGRYARNPSALLDHLADKANSSLDENDESAQSESEPSGNPTSKVIRRPVNPSNDPGLN